MELLGVEYMEDIKIAWFVSYLGWVEVRDTGDEEKSTSD